MKSLFLLILISLSVQVWSQEFDKKVLNWYNKGGMGMQTDVAYKKFLNDKKGEDVIVAVIDSGVDTEHEDLKGQIWVNEDEIPNNGIDDDQNGYIDDIHGWNFLGNASGEILNDVQLEMTRIVQKYEPIYADKKYSDLTEKEKLTFDMYKAAKVLFDKERKECENEVAEYKKDLDRFEKSDSVMKAVCGGECTFKEVKSYLNHKQYGEHALNVMTMWSYGFDIDTYKEGLEYWEHSLRYNYNVEINPRTLIGDDPSDFTPTGYGNNNVRGLGADHGTHVAGIIAGIRGNGLGGDGVSNHAKIMCLRAVPDGDEEDKDIALAITYAVDNGAKIINMSFGKAFSPYQSEMIKAFRYAEENDVLVVHAAGNEGADNDKGGNFPTSKYEGMSEKFTNWIEVGASTRFKKYKIKKGYLDNYGLVADFSNYGQEMVDVFAPGHDIVSAIPDDQYDQWDGTSMACPMVSGVAAILKSYYPQLTMLEIREIIIQSVQYLGDLKVIRPKQQPEIDYFKTMCVSGGVVNVYNACELAESKTNKDNL